MIDLIVFVTVALGCGVIVRVVSVRWLFFWCCLVLAGVLVVLARVSPPHGA